MKSMTREEYFEIYDREFPKDKFRFSCVKFDNVIFERECLFFDIFENCVFENVIFKNVSLLETFKKCSFINVSFTECNFRETTFTQCDFKNVKFDKGFLDVGFYLCNMERTYFIDSLIFSIYICHCQNKICTLSDSKVHCVYLYCSDPVDFPECCPIKGEFIAWKKAILFSGKEKKDVLVKLRIPADAKRTTFSVDCRADKADVIGIENMYGDPIEVTEGMHVYSPIFNNFEYVIGKTVYSDSFDEAMVTCSNGIHFFYEREEALNYEP